MVTTTAPVFSSANRARLRLDPAVDWFAPQPLWTVIPKAQLQARRSVPVILRFDRDDFMDVVMAQLNTAPNTLRDVVVQYETWRAPDVGLDANGSDKPVPTGKKLKLYQASHNRFYLVTAALACRLPGAPDRTIDAGRQESVFFVMRLKRGGGEFGWSTEQKTWVPIGDPKHMLLADEERHPLFPLTYMLDGVSRRILAGLVPVANREAQRGSTVPSSTFSQPGGDPRPGLFEQQVTAGVSSVDSWFRQNPSVPQTLNSAAPKQVERRQVEHAFAYALLDLLTALQTHLPALYNALMSGNFAHINTGQFGNAAALANLLKTTITYSDSATPPNPTYIWQVMRAVASKRAQLTAETFTPESEVRTLVGSTWRFKSGLKLDEWVKIGGLTPSSAAYPRGQFGRMAVQGAFESAISGAPYTPPAGESYPDLPAIDLTKGADTYIIRMVYDRPDCKLPTISEPTRPFILAPFFDPDAPVRPIRITMPVDTSTEGLRKYDKGVAVLISDQLRRQMDRVAGLKELMDGQVNDEGSIDIGMICSFSIPIITICALILLLIIVSLLNIIFWWLPFFKICLPIPLKRE